MQDGIENPIDSRSDRQKDAGNTALGGIRMAGRNIPYAEFQAMADDLVEGPRGDGRDAKARMFGIYRYTSKSTGRIYDCVLPNYDGKDPVVTEYPKPGGE